MYLWKLPISSSEISFNHYHLQYLTDNAKHMKQKNHWIFHKLKAVIKRSNFKSKNKKPYKKKDKNII